MVALALTFSLMTTAAAPCSFGEAGSGWDCMQAYWFSDVGTANTKAELGIVDAVKELPWMTLWRGEEVAFPAPEGRTFHQIWAERQKERRA